MKVTLKTVMLKDMVSRASKGCGNNKLIPITGLMSLKLDSGLFTITTTDGTNYLYIKADKVVGEDFEVTLYADVFSKLISRMTCEEVTLNFRPDVGVLEVRGNGQYKIDLPQDENGQLIRYPDPLSKFRAEEEGLVINRSTVQVILDTIKPALATTLENPCYTGYYVGDNVIATDTYKIACLDVSLFKKAHLVAPEYMNLLAVMTTEKINVNIDKNIIVCSTPDCTVYGRLMEGIEEYAIDAILSLVDTEFDSKCSIPKQTFLQLLDRLALFVGPYDKNSISLTFTTDGLQISSKASNGVEVIPYLTSDNFCEFICSVDIEMLAQEIKSIAADVIELYYGSDNSIKIVDGNITIIIALLEEETEE